jgi:DNA-binding MarR family transcriptional regulator
MEITEKEFAVIQQISDNHLPDQRMIADRTGISLGLTNLIIKRLIDKGYIKARQLNQKKIQYLLTPKGFAEKAQKSYNFTIKTIGLLKSLRERIQNLIMQKYDQGARVFIITGNNPELANLVELAFFTLALKDAKSSVEHMDGPEHSLDLLAICPDKQPDDRTDLIEFLSNTGMFWQ